MVSRHGVPFRLRASLISPTLASDGARVCGVGGMFYSRCMHRDEPLPDDVRRFVLAHIASVPHLEALLLLRGEPGRSWDVAAAARRLFLPERRTRRLLEDLAGSGFLERVEGGPASYRFKPGSGEIEVLVRRVADAYARSLIQITHLIHSRGEHRAQLFADAFKWRKDP